MSKVHPKVACTIFRIFCLAQEHTYLSLSLFKTDTNSLGHNLEEKSTHTAHLTLFFDEDLKVLVNDGDSKQDTWNKRITITEN